MKLVRWNSPPSFLWKLFSSILSLSFLLSNAHRSVVVATTATSLGSGNTTEPATGPPPHPPPDLPRSAENPMNSGLRGLYTMTAKFLDVVQPPGKNLYDELQVEKALNATSYDAIAAWKMAFRSRQPQFFLSYFVGFAVCLAFGAVFVVVMPVVGIFLCSCRCCCHACGHEDTGTPEKPTDRQTRICLGASLLIFTTFILAGAICSFVSNELVRRQTTSSYDDVRSRDVSERPPLNVIINGLEEMESFKRRTVQESKTLLEKTNHTVYKVLDTIFDFPNEAAAQIRRLMGTEEMQWSISSLNTTLIRVIESLNEVSEDYESLKEAYRSLNESLTQLESNLTSLCESGSERVCTVPEFSIGDGFDQEELVGLSDLIEILGLLVSTGFDTSALDKVSISNRIRREMIPVFEAVNRANISGIIGGLQATVESFAAKVPSLNPLMKNVNETKQNVEKYGNCRFYVCVAMSSFLLLIVLLNLLSLCVGALTDPPPPPPHHHHPPHPPPPPSDVRSFGVTRWTAGRCLLVSVVLMFVFCFALMIIVSLLFASGGVVYTECCRGFREGSQSNALVKTADALLQTTFPSVSFRGIIRDCEQGVGIVKALNLDETLTISGRMDLHNLADLDFTTELNVSSFDLSALTQSKSELEGVKIVSNIDEIRQKLNDSLVEMRSGLFDSINSLNETAANITNPELKKGVLDAADQLQFLSTTSAAKITESTNRLDGALTQLNHSLYLDNSTKSLAELLQDVTELIDITINHTKYNLPGLLHQLMENASTEVKSGIEAIVSEAKTQMMTSVGRCGPVVKIVADVYSSVCHSALNPYNSFWFSYGWCLFFFIPTIAVAVSLATLYFRSDDVIISCYDAYKSMDDYYKLQNFATPEDCRYSNKMDSTGVSHYASNPGYMGDGEDSVISRYQGNRDVGQPRGGSYGDKDSENSFRIQRPMVQTENTFPYDNNSARHRF